jgi:hypothetical protein
MDPFLAQTRPANQLLKNTFRNKKIGKIRQVGAHQGGF